MNSKVLLLSVAVIAIGLFAMPSTLSLFAGQHTFYNGSEVNCQKCHDDIYSEISTGSSAHTSLTQCQGCHKTGTLTNLVPYNGTGGNITIVTNVTGTQTAHAAVTMECVACHQGVPAELEGADAAHTAFYYNSSYTTNSSAGLTSVNQTVVKLKGANAACIGCHTHAVMNITWQRTTGYNITVDSTGSEKWNLTYELNSSTTKTTSSAGE